MGLKVQLQSLSKGSMSVMEYVEKKRFIADSLAENLHSVDDEDLIEFILQGLDPSYSPFIAAFMIKSDGVSIDHLVGLLLQEEARLEADVHRYSSLLPSPPPTPLLSANATQRYSSPRPSPQHFTGPNPQHNRSGPFSSGSDNRPQRRPVYCQICTRPGHEALNCWQRKNTQDFPATRPNPRTPQRQAHSAQFSSPSALDPTWYFDSGTTDHVSPDISKLSLGEQYSCSDKLQVGKGQDTSSRAR